MGELENWGIGEWGSWRVDYRVYSTRLENYTRVKSLGEAQTFSEGV